ncbi:hypothetical protein [Dehalobacter sp. 14DCB1]|uniref:hypothetical protein n=1 Tax=Dehalobacter sp. 14DCB1 TaxID=2070227 RepID=UPI001FAA0AE0|nr:hypothetical protein [Dehalobacter sp. 14DCB1]
MYEVNVSDDFGICQFGNYALFNPKNISSLSKKIIDISKPFTEWLPLLKEIKNMYIVSCFQKSDEISNAIELIRLCRNNHTFITVITPKASLRDQLAVNQIKNETDIFLILENEYWEDEKIVDPVSYAISFLVEAFDEVIISKDHVPWYDGPLYAFSKSGTAQIITFKVLKSEYEKENYEIADEIIEKLSGKRLALLNIKSGDDVRVWPKAVITKAVKRASGNMLYASWCSLFGQSIGKKTWVSAIVSDLDNEDNSYSNPKNRTFFQGGHL